MLSMTITDKGFRRLFLSFFMLSCMVPLLLMILMIYHYTVPALFPSQFTALRHVFDVGLVTIVLFQALGFGLIWWWVNSLERLTREVEAISSRHLGDGEAGRGGGRGELQRINRLVGRLHRELLAKSVQADSSARRLQDLDEELSTLSSTDTLTGLYNRRHFLRELAAAARRAERLGMNFWLVRLRVNRLSSFGDKNADAILQTVGRVVQKALPAQALPFATGRNEFALILHRGDGRQIARTTYRLVQAIESANYRNSRGVDLGAVSVACGIAGYKENVEVLCSAAWRAMETAGRLGRPIEVAGS